jgi:hypothetical protein
MQGTGQYCAQNRDQRFALPDLLGKSPFPSFASMCSSFI